MKFIILFLSFMLFSCSSNEQETGENSSFTINLLPSLSNVTIDQEVTVGISTNESINAIWVSIDNFTTGGYAVQDFGTNYTLHFNFDTLGQKKIAVRCKNTKGEIAEKQITVNVTRGNTIKITGLQVVSFYNMNTSYDPEYPNTNPNHLADLQFGFAKPKLNGSLIGSYSYNRWYLSSIIENQGAMIWDVSNQNLFISPTGSLLFTLADIDNGIAGADLLNGPPDYRTLSFSSYTNTKPSVITYSFPEINLEIKLNVEWAN